jgi:phosphoglycolate phosphatase-like HAD superfamily hydrolase
LAHLKLPHPHVEIHAVGLDVDGVLRDTGYDAFVALCKTVEELGGTPPAFSDYVHDYESKALEYYAHCGVKATDQVHSAYLRNLRPHDDVFPYEDVRAFLAHLHSLQLKVFVVSGHSTEKLHEWFAFHGLQENFVCVRGSSRNKEFCIRESCEEIGIDPRTTCYIGDMGLDMRAARANSLVSIGVTRGYESYASLMRSGANHVANDLSELLPLFE